MANTLEWVLGIIAVVALLMIFTGHLDLNLHLQAVSYLPENCPPFKSNAIPPFTTTTGYYLSDVWVIADCNQDGAYEKYGYIGLVGYGVDPATMGFRGATPEGYNWRCATPFVEVYQTPPPAAYDTPYVGAAFQENAGAASNADTSCTSQTTCNSKADLAPCDGVVSWAEFTTFAQNWLYGGNTWTDFISAAQAWVGG